MHSWLKLNGQPTWNVFIGNSAKTTDMGTEEETGDPTDPTKELTMKVRRGFRRKKWDEEKAKREGVAAKMAERFEDILAKKEEACVKRSDLKEEKKADRFKLLMEATDKKLKFEERRTMIEERNAALEEKKMKSSVNIEDAKVLSLNVASLDTNAGMIMQSIHYQMLQL